MSGSGRVPVVYSSSARRCTTSHSTDRISLQHKHRVRVAQHETVQHTATRTGRVSARQSEDVIALRTSPACLRDLAPAQPLFKRHSDRELRAVQQRTHCNQSTAHPPRRCPLISTILAPSMLRTRPAVARAVGRSLSSGKTCCQSLACPCAAHSAAGRRLLSSAALSSSSTRLSQFSSHSSRNSLASSPRSAHSLYASTPWDGMYGVLVCFSVRAMYLIADAGVAVLSAYSAHSPLSPPPSSRMPARSQANVSHAPHLPNSLWSRHDCTASLTCTSHFLSLCAWQTPTTFC